MSGRPDRRPAASATPPVRVTVDEVVVRGLSRRDADRLVAALSGEFAALVAERGAPARRAVAVLTRPAPTPRGRPDPAAIAQEVAAALWEDER